MKRMILTLLLAAATLAASAQKTVEVESTADEVVKWWDNATAPHSNGETRDERFDASNHLECTSETAFFIYKADPAKATGQGVVIIPGGGYRKVCISKGLSLAEWFRENGITTIVLKYRLPNLGHKEVPLEDTQAALKYMRDNAARLGIDPSKVGICGGSAGGHLAAYASTFTPDAEKPAYSILFYPVITGTTWHTHHNSFRYLLGDKRTPAEQEYYSLENRVSETTPPTILLLSDDDRVVPPISSILYYEALKRHGVKATMHIYPSGGHGWAGNNSFKYDADYKAAILDWLAGMNETN